MDNIAAGMDRGDPVLSPESALRELVERIKEELRPTPSERERIRGAIRESVERLRSALRDLGIPAEPVPVGSAVRDTWLPGKADIDVFLLFPLDYPYERLGPAALAAAERAFGEYRLRYASHPYAVVTFRGFEIDVVPAYSVSSYEEIRSPVDRTVLHNRFLQRKLNDQLRDEIRVLKAFMRGIGAYGAELAVSGFSGYLTELLILAYGSFTSLVDEAAGWGSRVVLALEGGVSEWVSESTDPLIVIDPVDPRRNVASAVSETQLNRFKAACRALLRSPSREFFVEKGLPPVGLEDVKSELKRRGTHLLLILFDGLREAPDTLWSQAISGSRRLMRSLDECGFLPIQAEGWTDEEERVALIAEIERTELSRIVRRVGPEVGGPGEEDFLEKHLGARDTLGGPFIEGSRWVAYKLRRPSDIWEFTEEFLGERGPLPKILRASARRARVLTEADPGFPAWGDLLPVIWEMLLRRRDFFARYLASPEG